MDGKTYNKFVVISYDYMNDKVDVIHISLHYPKAVEKLISSYQEYSKNKDYIVRETMKHHILVYKRTYGYLWNSKIPYKHFKIIGYNEPQISN